MIGSIATLLCLLFISLTFTPGLPQTSLPSACPAVDDQVPFYFDPSVGQEGNQISLNDPVGICSTCGEPRSLYFATAPSDTLFNGQEIPDHGDVLNPISIGGVRNAITTVLNCTNACVCSANGLCAQVTTPMTYLALYPYCSSERLLLSCFFALPCSCNLNEHCRPFQLPDVLLRGKHPGADRNTSTH